MCHQVRKSIMVRFFHTLRRQLRAMFMAASRPSACCSDHAEGPSLMRCCFHKSVGTGALSDFVAFWSRTLWSGLLSWFCVRSGFVRGSVGGGSLALFNKTVATPSLDSVRIAEQRWVLGVQVLRSSPYQDLIRTKSCWVKR